MGTSEEVFTILPYISWACTYVSRIHKCDLLTTRLVFSGVRTHALSDGSLILATLVVLLNGLYIVPDVVSAVFGRRECVLTGHAVSLLEHKVRQ